MDELLRFMQYIEDHFEADEIEEAMENYDFDKYTLSEAYLENLSEKEVLDVFAEFVDIIVNELDGGDVETMRDVLRIVLEIDRDTVDYLLDFDERE